MAISTRLAATCLLTMSLFAEGAPLTAVDFAGKPVQLFADRRPAVLVFVRTDCPISNRYAPELERIYREYASRAAFYLVYPSRGDTGAAIRGHLADYGYTFGALRDADGTLVKLSRVRVTPEAALFSSDGELLYHGRIDDRYIAFGTARPEPTTHDLEQALESVLAGKPVKEPSTRAIGCFLADVK